MYLETTSKAFLVPGELEVLSMSIPNRAAAKESHMSSCLDGQPRVYAVCIILVLVASPEAHRYFFSSLGDGVNIFKEYSSSHCSLNSPYTSPSKKGLLVEK